MTAPTLIRYLLETARNNVTISSYGRTSEPFPLFFGAWLEDEDGNQGRITSLSPFSVSGNVSGDMKPLYPYFDNGSVLKAVGEISESKKRRFPFIILDTLDRSETTDELGFKDYDLRAFIATYAKDTDYADQFAEVYEKGLDELANWFIEILDFHIFTGETKTHRERWGDSGQYGRTESNVFDILTDAIEITGNFKFNSEACINAK